MSDPTIDRTPALTQSEIRARVAGLGEWFHNLDLAGVATAPNHFLGDYPTQKWRGFQHAVAEDLRGATVLDVGCNAGFYSLEMKRRGAERVVAIDSSETYLAQARFAAQVRGMDIEFKNLSVYEVGRLGERFDVVIFMGVLYHLRHPLLALDLLHEHVTKDVFIFQTMQRGPNGRDLDEDYPFSETEVFEGSDAPRAVFIEKSYAGDPTNWWIPNEACSRALLRSAGFEVTNHPEPEVYICRHRELEPSERQFLDLPRILP
jgi:tRNA (mo5U34)-methyltransferase